VGWYIRNCGDLDAAANAQILHGFPHYTMIDLLDMLDLLRLRIGHADAVVEFLVDIDINVFINGSADYGAAMRAVEGR
jgi:hypothetical protein